MLYGDETVLDDPVLATDGVTDSAVVAEECTLDRGETPLLVESSLFSHFCIGTIFTGCKVRTAPSSVVGAKSH